MGNKLSILNKHFENNFWLYTITIFCWFLGIMLGIFSVKYMGINEKKQLSDYLINFTNSYQLGEINKFEILLQAAKNNLPLILLIWFLGLTIIGAPIILILNIIKGYVFGFSISFIVKGLGAKGLEISILCVLLQNVVYITCFIIVSVIAMEFSFNFIKNSNYKRISNGILIHILSYSFCFLLISFVLTFGFLFEAYVAPFFIKILVK